MKVVRLTAMAVLVAAMGVAFIGPVLADTAKEKPGGTFNVTYENDVFNGTDQNYTNGVSIQYTDTINKVPHGVRYAAAPFIDPGADIRVTYQLGQNLYTPQDIERKIPDPDDRPYAGWLYGSIGVLADTDDSLTSLQLSLGVVGPAALGEQVQSFVHSAIDTREPRGWGSQLKNEPALLLTFERKWAEKLIGEPYGDFRVDASPYVGGALGNVFTHANAGITFRLGYDLPDNDYGPPRIQPATPGSGFFEPTDNFGWYLFAGIEARAVARNIFLDGNTFRDSASVDKNMLVGDLSYGLVFTVGQARISLTQVLRSPEISSESDISRFTSLGVTYRF